MSEPIHPFDVFWESFVFPEIAAPVIREAAKSAWDAALCAGSAAAWDSKGKILPALTIAANVSDLHTWVKPKA